MRLSLTIVLVFLGQIILQVLSFLTTLPLETWVMQWLMLPSDLSELVYKPWTIITYMFIHAGFIHLFFNLMVLYFTGKIFLEYLGDKRLFSTFILGGISGGLLFIAMYNLSPAFTSHAPLLGASAGVMAVLFAVAAKAPQLRVKLFFVLEVPIWAVALLLVVLDLAQMPVENPGGHLSHLGGALYGYLYIQRLNRGKDWSNFFYDTLNKIAGIFSKKPKLTTVHNRYRADDRRHDNEPSEQKIMDEILDKIQQSGYEKLTKEEKDFLFKYSKK